MHILFILIKKPNISRWHKEAILIGFLKKKEKRNGYDPPSEQSIYTVTGMFGENPLTVSVSPDAMNDIVQAAMRSKATAVSKLAPVHIREAQDGFVQNPKGFESIKWLLQQPNPYMSMQDLLYKLSAQREERGNSYAYIECDGEVPAGIYPIESSAVEMYNRKGQCFLKFSVDGEIIVKPYDEVIHLRKDFNKNAFFGDKNNGIMTGLSEVINMTDRGIVKAIQNSAVIRWIMKFFQPLQPNDVKIRIDEFNNQWLNVNKQGGVVPQVGGQYELTQVEPKNYVPDGMIIKQAAERIYAYYGVNEKIVQNKYNENEWNAFYESEVEPAAMQLSHEFTRTMFSKHQREFGNRIVFSSESLQYASMKTKLALMSMVDRGAMTPNEWRSAMNLPPIPGGDIPVRRLDTAPVGDEYGSKIKDDSGEGGEDDE